MKNHTGDLRLGEGFDNLLGYMLITEDEDGLRVFFQPLKPRAPHQWEVDEAYDYNDHIEYFTSFDLPPYDYKDWYEAAQRSSIASRVTAAALRKGVEG